MTRGVTLKNYATVFCLNRKPRHKREPPTSLPDHIFKKRYPTSVDNVSFTNQNQ